MSTGFTLEAIRPLVGDQRTAGRTLLVTFRCPVSGKNVQARWTPPQNTSVGSAVAKQAKKSVWYETRRQVNSLLYGVLGHGAMASIATNVVNTAMNTVDPGGGGTGAPVTGVTPQDQETGLLEAFQSVSGQFAWVGNRWVHGSAAKALMSPFDAQLAAFPVSSAYDRQILARMLIEVASAHDGLGEDEQLFLGDVIAPDLGSLESLRRRPQLTEAELAETTAGDTRISMLALVWSLAFCDEDLAQAELTALERLAGLLGLPADKAGRARELARGMLVDQALERMFTWGEHDADARDMLYALGEKIGMSRADVERAEARYQKRKGG